MTAVCLQQENSRLEDGYYCLGSERFHSHETLPYIVFIFSVYTVMLLTAQSVGGVRTYVGWANKLAVYIEGVSISN